MTNCAGIQKNQPRELMSGDDVKKIVSEALKRVDNFIRKGELDEAERNVLQAREIDPKNIYAYAFQERITLLKEQARQNLLAAAACKATEEAKRMEEEHKRKEDTRQQMEQPKPEPRPQPVPRVIPEIEPATGTKKELPSVIKGKEAPHSNIEVVQKERPTNPPTPTAMPTLHGSQQGEAQRKSEEERNLKIQRMITFAVESVRKEVEMKQTEIRAREREEFERLEKIKIKDAAEAATKAEEQRQVELRKKSEDQLQQKIREALQHKPVVSTLVVSHQQVADAIPTTLSGRNQTVPVPEPKRLVSAERLETLERYRLVLSSVWADGAISENEASTLKQLRESLSISSEEHARLEKDVQRETYVDAFKNAWHSGTITQENASVLAELRRRFQISNEEHLAIESTILSEIQPVKDRPTLLVVDDDERLLTVVSKTLNDAGFITTPVATSDEAYAYLKESSPDLILCDVNLETSTMGGFAFYEKVREFERLRDTPFIFLSGLTDEALVRTGKELGADDYLCKPVSEETLVATIRGKLRRYHELKERMN